MTNAWGAAKQEDFLIQIANPCGAHCHKDAAVDDATVLSSHCRKA